MTLSLKQKFEVILKTLTNEYEVSELPNPDLEIDELEAKLQADVEALEAAIQTAENIRTKEQVQLNYTEAHIEEHKAKLGKVKDLLRAVA